MNRLNAFCDILVSESQMRIQVIVGQAENCRPCKVEGT